MKCIGIDGESISPWGYCLLSSSGGRPLSERRRLTSRECFDFLLSQRAEGDRLFGYGIGYDVCHWVADLTNAEKHRLATRGVTHTIQGATAYRLTYRPNTYFTVQRMEGLMKSKVLATATVVDLMRWHRKPFVDACEEWDCLGDLEAEAMKIVKSRREAFDCDAYRTVSDYNERECIAIADLAEGMTSRLTDLGIPVSHPFTAGAVAGALMARNRVQDHWREPTQEVSDAVSRAFFGGREQCSRYGYFRDVTQWDIRSAYGWAMTQLPDMLGEWVHDACPASNTHWPETRYPDTWSLFKVKWDIDEGKHPVMPFPWRADDGRVHYPPRGTGWHWSPLVRASIRNYPSADIRILDAWHYVPSSQTRPLHYIGNLYDQRRLSGSNPVGSLLKSIIVSTWGRMCSPGQRASKTRGQLDWAGMVTALIQERMIDAIHQTNREKFISCCVDGFWTTNRDVVMDHSEAMGGWACSNADELLLLRPACYWKREAEQPWSAHTSGIPGGVGIINDALDQWRTAGWQRGRINLARRRVKGLLSCAADGNYDQLGQFVDLPLSVTFNPGYGRMGHECPTMQHGDTWRRWLPYWPPTASLKSESASFVSRTGLVDDRWKERREANAIEETSE